MRIIVVGCGKIGYTIAKNLSEKKDIHVTVVDTNPDIFEYGAAPLDVIFINGNGANERILMEAGANDADLIVCTTDSDEVNVLCCIMAERLGTGHSIARVRNPEYMLEFNKLWKDLGIDMVINPERQTARAISRFIRYPVADEVDTFMNGRVELVGFRVAEAPEHFVGKRIADVFDKKMGVLLAVVERGEEAFIPSGDFIFSESDVIKLMGRPSNIMNFFVNIKKRPKKVQEVMVIGGGRITHYLAELLNRHDTRTNLKIIEKDREKGIALYDALTDAGIDRHCLLIEGDGTDEDLLRDEDVDRMDALICLTNRDEENAIIGLYGMRQGVKKVIAKINHLHQGMIMHLGLGLGGIITPQNISADIVERYVDSLTGVVGGNIRTMHRLSTSPDGHAEAIEFLVNQKSGCTDIALTDLELKPGILVGCINRGREILIPSGDTRIQVGDSVIIITKDSDVLALDDILAK